MSSNCAGLPSSFDRFREIWNRLRVPTGWKSLPGTGCDVCKEYRTGTEIVMRRAQLLHSTRTPFDTGPDTLVTSYAIVAELSASTAALAAAA